MYRPRSGNDQGPREKRTGKGPTKDQECADQGPGIKYRDLRTGDVPTKYRPRTGIVPSKDREWTGNVPSGNVPGMYRPRTRNEGPGDQGLGMCRLRTGRQRTVNVPIKDRECTDQGPGMCRPKTRNVPTKDRECTDQGPGMCRPATGNVPTNDREKKDRESTDQGPRMYRPRTGNVQTKDRECTDQGPGMYLTLTPDLAVAMLDGGTVWGHDKIPCGEGWVAHFNARSRRADVGWWNRVKTR